MIKAFLSHTSLDKDLVGLVHSKLMPSNAWYDAANIENGESIPEKINEGLRNATHYVLFWSERASKSSWVRAELNAAFVRMLANKCKFMIFTLDDTELPELLQPYKFDKLDKTDLITSSDVVVAGILSQEGSMPKLSEFVNRTKEIGDIESAAREGYKLIILHGLLGIGKASLAEKALQWLYANRASTRISLNFDTIPGMAELAIELSRKTGKSLINDNADLDKQKENIRFFFEVISAANQLVILENIKNWLNEDGTLSENLRFVTDLIVDEKLFEGITIATSSRFVEVPYDYYEESIQIPVKGMDDSHIADIIHNNLPSSYKSNKKKNLEFAKRLYGYPLGAKLGAYRISNLGYDYFLKQPQKIQELKLNLAKQLITYAGISEDCQEYLKILALSQSRLTNEEYSMAFPSLAHKIGALTDEAFFAGLLEIDENGCYKIETLVEDYYYDLAFNSDNRREICRILEEYLVAELNNASEAKYYRLLPATVHILTLNSKIDKAVELRAELTATIAKTMWDQYNHADYDEAMKTAEGLLTINSSNYEARYVKALCLTRFDEFNTAEDILNDLLDEDEQNSARYYYALGRIRKRQGEYDEAIELFNVAVLKKKRYSSPYREMAECYLHLSQFNHAQDAIQKAKEIDDSNIFVVLLEAHLLQKQGNAEKAIEILTELSLLDQNRAQILFRKGRAFDQMGEIGEAKSCYLKALECNGKMDDARLCLLNHQIIDEPSEAEKQINKLRPILRGKRKAILTNIEARFIGYSKHSEDTALELLETVSQKYRDKQWYAVKIQLLEKIISKNEKAGRKILAEQLLKEQERIKNEFQVRYGESAISDIDLLPDM